MTAYGGMAKVQLGDYRQGFVRLRVKDGARWEWANVPVQAPPYLDALLRESDRERERISAVRAEQKRRMAAAAGPRRSLALLHRVQGFTPRAGRSGAPPPPAGRRDR